MGERRGEGGERGVRRRRGGRGSGRRRVGGGGGGGGGGRGGGGAREFCDAEFGHGRGSGAGRPARAGRGGGGAREGVGGALVADHKQRRVGGHQARGARRAREARVGEDALLPLVPALRVAGEVGLRGGRRALLPAPQQRSRADRRRQADPVLERRVRGPF
uniref:Uncharacterized protein n=1 Tax=Emiliania huxleyi (strain CCMP1516) TaxID=280463 RepID=A0A0D3JA83_EMIH1